MCTNEQNMWDLDEYIFFFLDKLFFFSFLIYFVHFVHNQRIINITYCK